MTVRLYLDDPYLASFSAVVTGSEAGWISLSSTAFYPGGGGQPHDCGSLQSGERTTGVEIVREDAHGEIWHQVDSPFLPGAEVSGRLDWARRYSLMRHHTLLHIFNALVYQRHGGLITGAQIGEQTSHIDFRIEGFSRAMLQPLADEANSIIASNLPLEACRISEEEFRERPELTRTLTVAPPVVDGVVRVVSMGRFDAQACGGTHVHGTGELGTCRILKFDNKGKNNKRIYVTLGENGLAQGGQ